MAVDFNTPMPLYGSGTSFRDFMLYLEERFYFATLAQCQLRLAVQTGLGQEFLKYRAASKHGATRSLDPIEGDLVNRCVANWNEAIAKSQNPGILHEELGIPTRIAQPIVAEVLKYQKLLDGPVTDVLGAEAHTLQRIARGVGKQANGAIYFRAVRILAETMSRHKSEIIHEPTLIALSKPPRSEYLMGIGGDVELKLVKEPKILTLDKLLIDAIDPDKVRALWGRYGPASYSERVSLVLDMRTALKEKSKIDHADIDASLKAFYNGNGSH